jgi:hypothetical protein
MAGSSGAASSRSRKGGSMGDGQDSGVCAAMTSDVCCNGFAVSVSMRQLVVVASISSAIRHSGERCILPVPEKCQDKARTGMARPNWRSPMARQTCVRPREHLSVPIRIRILPAGGLPKSPSVFLRAEAAPNVRPPNESSSEHSCRVQKAASPHAEAGP